MSIRQRFAFPRDEQNNAPGHAPDSPGRLDPVTGQHTVPGFAAPPRQPAPDENRFHVRGEVQRAGRFESSVIGDREPLTRKTDGDDGEHFSKTIKT